MNLPSISPCQGCGAFNTSQQGLYANWCVALNRSARVALPRCREEKARELWEEQREKWMPERKVGAKKIGKAA